MMRPAKHNWDMGAGKHSAELRSPVQGVFVPFGFPQITGLSMWPLNTVERTDRGIF